MQTKQYTFLILGLVLQLAACAESEQDLEPGGDSADVLFGGLGSGCLIDLNCGEDYECEEAVAEPGEESGKNYCMQVAHDDSWYDGWNPEDYVTLRETGSCPDCELRWAVLKKADLAGANLAGANFHSSLSKKAIFDGANLESASFWKANLTRASFVGANLKGVSFQAAVLTGTDFSGADLTGAALSTKRVGGGTVSLDNTLCDEDTIFPEDFSPLSETKHRIYCEDGIVTWELRSE